MPDRAALNAERAPACASRREGKKLAWLRAPRVPVHIRAAATRALAAWQSSRTAGSCRIGNNNCRAAALLTTVLPMEPQSTALRGQWFEGWFIRLVDHHTSSTVSIIFGSLRRRDRPPSAVMDGPFDEHLLALGYSDGRDGDEDMHQILLDGSAVQLSGGRADGGSARGDGPRLSWWSGRHGGMRVDGDTTTLDLTLARGVRLVANMSGARVPWDPRRPDAAGPEGWLSRTGLLPCHYFVHSFGSRATYSLWTGGRHSSTATRRPTLAGRARAHVERNWGDAFPTGWVWAQASAAHGRAYLVLTGGRFVIGPLTTDSYVIGLRVPAAEEDGSGAAGLAWDFRTTDLDRVHETRMPCDGALTVNATSRDGRRRLALWLRAPPRSFGAPIHVPTNDAGFSADPGCRESNTAVLTLAAWEQQTVRGAGGRGAAPREDLVLRYQAEVPLAVLEFGGNFQCG